MTQAMRIQSAVQVCGPESIKAIDAGCVQGRQRGFSLVSAIFLLVVIAALGAFAVTVSTAQQQSAALDVLGSRAYQASRAGVEWGAFQLIQSGVAGGAFATACQPGPTSAPVALAGTLASFNVTVSCAATSHAEATTTLWVYRLSSLAATPGQPGTADYVERQISVTIAQ